MNTINEWRLPRKMGGVSIHEARRLTYILRRLRKRDLGYRTIAVVFEEFEGYELNEHEVRLWCDRLNLPKNPNKSRA